MAPSSDDLALRRTARERPAPIPLLRSRRGLTNPDNDRAERREPSGTGCVAHRPTGCGKLAPPQRHSASGGRALPGWAGRLPPPFPGPEGVSGLSLLRLFRLWGLSLT